jgi:hypothetical protein
VRRNSSSKSPEEQRLLRVGVEPDVVGRAAVRLYDAYGIDQCDIVRLRRGRRTGQASAGRLRDAKDGGEGGEPA